MIILVYVISLLRIILLKSIYIYTIGGIFGFFLLLAVVYIFYKTFNIRKIVKEAALFENKIKQIKNPIIIERKINQSYRNQAYREGIILIFHLFRLSCKNLLSIRNSLTDEYSTFIKKLAGIQGISLTDLNYLGDLYYSARYTTNPILFDDFIKAKKIYEKISEIYTKK